MLKLIPVRHVLAVDVLAGRWRVCGSRARALVLNNELVRARKHTVARWFASGKSILFIVVNEINSRVRFICVHGFCRLCSLGVWG